MALVDITVLFFLLSFPLFISFIIVAASGQHFAVYFSRIPPHHVVVLQAGFLITVIACLQNPIIYFSFMPAFRQALPCKCIRSSNSIHNSKSSSNQVTPDNTLRERLQSLS